MYLRTFLQIPWFLGTMLLTRTRQVRTERLNPRRHFDISSEKLVSALQSVFARHDISVSFSPIPRTLSPSTSDASKVPVTESEDHVAAANPRTMSSEDIPPILYIGSSSLGLTNLLLTHPTTPVCTAIPFCILLSQRNFLCYFQVHGYDPVTREATLQSTETNKLLMRRYAIVQKARDADVFGILVGTLGVGSPPNNLLLHLSLS